ncbi:dUTP diphosphatase [Barrientosiimonas marina]|uniref:dUTP diphosphatase n=1 Tax=Lentibacillus kimchii TaxID=1542911 RepID=A0ABW2UV71_9BACI
MDWSALYTMQEHLDTYIEAQHNLSDRDLFREKYLALLVELGELANETRCFKFWSTKPKNEQSVILEEYVDGIHFILSLGLEKGYRFDAREVEPANTNVTGQFTLVYSDCVAFYQEPGEAAYKQLFVRFIQLGKLLGFDETAVMTAYLKKNDINYERQNQGY